MYYMQEKWTLLEMTFGWGLNKEKVLNYFHYTSECLDIDYEWEFRLCEAFYKENNLSVIIHTNRFNLLTALISQYSFEKNIFKCKYKYN